jgi:hypothetical protein
MVAKRLVLCGAALLSLVTNEALAQTALRVNEIADVQGVRTACGGASLEDQQTMSAQGYPVILKLVGANGQWLGEERLTISGHGQSISLGCEGPWVAMQLPPGRYRATAEVEGASPKTVSFTVGRGGRDVMIRFPEIAEGRTEPL